MRIFDNRNPQYETTSLTEDCWTFPIITDDHSRVVLDNDEADSDYINANYVPVIYTYIDGLVHITLTS